MEKLTEKELHALISLLDDTDLEVKTMYVTKYFLWEAMSYHFWKKNGKIVSTRKFKKKLKNWFMGFSSVN
jgi:hypothetical protein